MKSRLPSLLAFIDTRYRSTTRYSYVDTSISTFTNHIVPGVLGIALVQINLYNNKVKPVEYVLKLLKKLGLSDSDIICLPELWYAKLVKNFETEFYKIICRKRI